MLRAIGPEEELDAEGNDWAMAVHGMEGVWRCRR